MFWFAYNTALPSIATELIFLFPRFFGISFHRTGGFKN